MPPARRTGREELPSTIARSDEHAQAIWSKTHDSAVETYGEGERAHRTAFAALKHSYRKEGDRWVPKETKGPSDPAAALGYERRRGLKTAGGREVPLEEWPRDALYARAQQLEVKGRSSLKKPQLIEAIRKAAAS